MSLKIVKFETRLNGQGKPFDVVLLTNRGNVDEQGRVVAATWQRVAKLVPPPDLDRESPRGRMMHDKWEIIEPAYSAWKSNHELPEDGTPLGAWAGVTPDQAEILRQFGMKTVEDVASMPEAVVPKVPLPQARKLREQAAAWLAGKPAEEQAREIENLKAQLSTALEMLAERQDAPAAEDKPKRRGRPPKAAQESEAA